MNHVKHVIPMSDMSVSISPEDIQPTVLPDAFIQSEPHIEGRQFVHGRDEFRPADPIAR